MLCYFLLYHKVNQLYSHIYPSLVVLPSPITLPSAVITELPGEERSWILSSVTSGQGFHESHLCNEVTVKTSKHRVCRASRLLSRCRSGEREVVERA